MSQASQKFKPGDKVINIDGMLGKGKKIFTVVRDYSEGRDKFITVRVDDGLESDGWLIKRFEYANKNKHSLLKRFIETGEGNAEEVIKLFNAE